MEKSYSYCKKLFFSSRNYLFDPHISIAYGNFTPEKLHYATKGIDIPKHLSFSSIAVVRTGENIGDLQLTNPPFSSTTTPSRERPFEEDLQTALLEPPITVSFKENQSSKSLDDTTFDGSVIFYLQFFLLYKIFL